MLLVSEQMVPVSKIGAGMCVGCTGKLVELILVSEQSVQVSRIGTVCEQLVLVSRIDTGK